VLSFFRVTIVAIAALLSGCTPAWVPLAGPSPLPTATTEPALTVSPSSVQILNTGSNSVQTISVKESGYTGTFNESDTCNGVATITTTNATGPATTYDAVGLAPGFCTATFSDSGGRKQSVAITVTTSGFGIQLRRYGS
jgi:hypothetical protein